MSYLSSAARLLRVTDDVFKTNLKILVFTADGSPKLHRSCIRSDQRPFIGITQFRFHNRATMHQANGTVGRRYPPFWALFFFRRKVVVTGASDTLCSLRPQAFRAV